MYNLLIKARNNGYAVPGFNFNFYDDAMGIVLAAYELKSPVFLMASEGCVKFLGIRYIMNFVKLLKEEFCIPIILHLDHGKSLELIKKCIDSGFDSIMYDGSLLNFEDNIKNTSLVANLCHQKNILVEGELGRISGREDTIENIDDVFTLPESVPEFIQRTNVDSLAVSIGNAHGLYKGKPKLDFERLEKINKLSRVPLVLHGGTGISYEDIKHSIDLGIAKVNIGTELKITYIKAMKNYIDNKNDNNVRNVVSLIQNDIKELVKKYINLVGSKNKMDSIN
ncbi:class II fructose-bisphosphate aldolase [Thermoanaerobacterium thermosaccharolyticum]|uniref:class II fructose-bisphosphate aldolase n=1 Tax=Thermoanaerobacterium thermosaccharolyticum TaxID=1517 RepID=UPI003DA8C399